LRKLDIHRECDPQSLHNPLHPKKIGKNQKDPPPGFLNLYGGMEWF